MIYHQNIHQCPMHQISTLNSAQCFSANKRTYSKEQYKYIYNNKNTDIKRHHVSTTLLLCLKMNPVGMRAGWYIYIISTTIPHSE